ncbi:MAG: heme biosynthesis HemY N-terminal domain-containing protein [Porticoccaceae bacterium]
MRKLLIIVAGALLSGAVIYQLLANQQGYLLLSAGNYVLETSLWGALVVLVLILAAVFLVWRLWRLMFYPRSWWRRRASRKQLKVRDQTVQGILDYLEGNWPKAVTNLKRGIARSEMPALNYLGAAAASFNLGDMAEVETLLQEAQQSAASDPLTLGLLKVRMLLQDNNFDKALPQIEALHRKYPSHPTVLRLLAATRKGLRDWRSLEAMLADLKKHKAVSSSEFTALEIEVYHEVIAGFEGVKSVHKSLSEQQAELDHLWDRLPGKLQKNNRLVAAYVEQLTRLDLEQKAETQLRRFINKHWDDHLVELYGQLQGDDPRVQLSVAEAWLRDHPDNPSLLQTLGRLCVRNQLWGKAKEYFESALKLRSSPQVWLELGELLQILQDARGSNDCFRKGLKEAVK